MLDDLSTGTAENIEHLRARPDFHLVVDSVLSESVVNELVYKCDVVYHLAAAVGVRLIVERPVHTMVTNVQGTEIVLDHCSRFGKRVLVASSSEVYGDHREERPLAEGDRRVYGPTTEKRWLYADSKAMDEFLALGFHQERGLDCVIVRLFNTVGPRQSGQYGMVIPRFVERALSGAPLEVHGDGNQTRSFCHVQDTIRALAGLMLTRATSRARSSTSAAPTASRSSSSRTRRRHTSSSPSCVRSVFGGLRPRHRGHAPPRACDRQDQGAIGWKPTRWLDDILGDVLVQVRQAPLPVDPPSRPLITGRRAPGRPAGRSRELGPLVRT